VAARLVDVAPDGTETLVARGLYRPTAEAKQVFQLHPNGWKFAKDHVAKLQLLPSDAPYGRTSNGQAPVTVSDLELRLPVLEQPGTGPVRSPAAKVLPPGYKLAVDFRPTGGGGGSGGDGGDAQSCTATPISGTKKDDKLRGTSDDDVIRGRGGDDRLKGSKGDDCLRGGTGSDTLSGGPGADILACGPGRHDVARAGAGDTVRGCERKRRG
jgi:hypothetical protein